MLLIVNGVVELVDVLVDVVFNELLSFFIEDDLTTTVSLIKNKIKQKPTI